jgi:hypothetical protein
MEKFLDLLDKFFAFAKWPYFIGYTLGYNYIQTHILLDLLWLFAAILIVQDLYKRYKAEQERKEEEKREKQAQREAEMNEIIEGSKSTSKE